jgi:hypothetical protein
LAEVSSIENLSYNNFRFSFALPSLFLRSSSEPNSMNLLFCIREIAEVHRVWFGGSTEEERFFMLLYSYPDSYKHYYYVEISKEQGRNKDINSVLNLSFY